MSSTDPAFLRGRPLRVARLRRHAVRERERALGRRRIAAACGWTAGVAGVLAVYVVSWLALLPLP
ncbi:MAG: hypothetical protein V2J02_20330 [Pseudomonadales bacterium]|nr:hypothetical protein [Pseudomonadales bacterium]